jgi:hypothetical protein
MSMISRCPRCAELVSIPEGLVAEAGVRCPLCAAEYSLADALAALPPELVAIEPIDVTAIQSEPAEADMTQPTSAEAGIIDPESLDAVAPPPEPVSPAVVHLTPREARSTGPESIELADVQVEPIAAAPPDEPQGTPAIVVVEPPADFDFLDDDSQDEIALAQGPSDDAASSDSNMSLDLGDLQGGQEAAKGFAETIEALPSLPFAEDETGLASDFAMHDDPEADSELEFDLQPEPQPPAPARLAKASGPPPLPTLPPPVPLGEDNEVVAPPLPKPGKPRPTYDADAISAALFRHQRRNRNPIAFVLGLVLFGFLGIAVAYYGLNYFGGEQFDLLSVYLPGCPHTYDHWPVGDSKPKQTTPRTESAGRSNSPATDKTKKSNDSTSNPGTPNSSRR